VRLLCTRICWTAISTSLRRGFGFHATSGAGFSDHSGQWFFSDPRADVGREPLMRDAGSLARGRDDVGRLCTEHTIQNFIRGYCDRDDQPDWRAFIADADRGDVEFRHDVVDRLFGQLWQVPLGQVVPDLRNGVH
jgi:hypothetical protein